MLYAAAFAASAERYYADAADAIRHAARVMPYCYDIRCRFLRRYYAMPYMMPARHCRRYHYAFIDRRHAATLRHD